MREKLVDRRARLKQQIDRLEARADAHSLASAEALRVELRGVGEAIRIQKQQDTPGGAA